MTTVSGTSPYGRKKLDAISPKYKGQHMSSNDSSAASHNFDCSICLEESQEPVVTMCGHLFCWSCLHQWITIHSVLEECPVCKTCVKDKIIPLYGRGKTGFTPESNTEMHNIDRPRRPSPHLNLPSVSRLPHRTGSHQYAHQQRHAQENYGFGGSYLSSSGGAFGLFPALFGVHTVMSLDHSVGYPSETSYNSVSFRMPAISSMSSQQRRLNAQQEFVLYWFLILLAVFTVLCFLLF
ncbi:hypothetical protein L7F22_017403 [Adiantum nelumboides]|nr:hypothetical protein [Adiantum nelumboides]